MSYDYNKVIAAIEPPNEDEVLIKRYQNTGDIVKDLVYCLRTYNAQAVPVAKMYYTGDVSKDGKNIWNFIRDNIKYEAEPTKDQTTRSFSRIIHDKEGDCKHSALIVGSIAWNMGYNVVFRFVAYKDAETYGHVYTLIQDTKIGKTVIVDPLQDFNSEKPFVKKMDYKFLQPNTKKMALSRLTGVDDIPEENKALARAEKFREEFKRKNKTHRRVIRGGKPVWIKRDQPFNSTQGKESLTPEKKIEYGSSVLPVEHRIFDRGTNKAMTLTTSHAELSGIGRRTKAQRQQGRKSRKAARKARGGAFRAIALAPVRGAMSALFELNFLGFATSFQQVIQQHPDEAKHFAMQLGYKYNTLVKQVAKGASKRQLGAIGQTVVAIAAIAAPAIIILVTLLKKLGIITPKQAAALDTAVAQADAVASGDPTAGGAIQPNDLQHMADADKIKNGPPPGGGLMKSKILGIPAPIALLGILGAGYLLTKD
jgi:hypothetical protein